MAVPRSMFAYLGLLACGALSGSSPCASVAELVTGASTTLSVTTHAANAKLRFLSSGAGAGGVDMTGSASQPIAGQQVSDDCADAIDGGGWTLVRHTKVSAAWGPWSDNLAGSTQLGEPAGGLAGHDWTVPWDSTDKEFLFAFGDCSSWLITTPAQVNGENYANEPRWILKSSEQDMPYQARWFNRAPNVEDPWVSTLDHFDSGEYGPGAMLYGEASCARHFDQKNTHGGANVYIRWKATTVTTTTSTTRTLTSSTTTTTTTTSSTAMPMQIASKSRYTVLTSAGVGIIVLTALSIILCRTCLMSQGGKRGWMRKRAGSRESDLSSVEEGCTDCSDNEDHDDARSGHKHNGDARLRDPAWAAVSLAQLQDLLHLAKEELGEAFDKATMYDINVRILQPLCDQHKKPYAHIVNGSSPLHVDVFISHAWGENFAEFVKSVRAPFLHWTVKPNVWICALALIQSADPAVVASQVSSVETLGSAPFTKALAKAEKILVVRNDAVDLYERIWCCWELYIAYEQGHVRRPGAIMVTGPASFSSGKDVDIECASAANLDDKMRILAHVATMDEGFLEINQKLTEIRNFCCHEGR